jgi:hypothetical protein
VGLHERLEARGWGNRLGLRAVEFVFLTSIAFCLKM